ncbi:hypothetical protein [Kitasatospora sp. NPDC093806]|uniref:SCO2583/SCO2584 N-terminal domain-containing protein n=1 Tax=Kitasatospora sp. NPDC093806 TaxID=3155075 RepID=UPI00341385D6
MLDERFVRAAAVKEPTARTRMLTARWRKEAPVDPGGRRWSPGPTGPAGAARAGGSRRPRPRWQVWLVIAVVAALVVIGLGPGEGLNWSGRSADLPAMDAGEPGRPRPAADVALPGGGVFAGSKCGVRGYHHFALPGRPAEGPTGVPGPQALLGSYGFSRSSATDAGRFEVSLLLGPGRGRVPLDLAPPLGAQGVAVEIEGPDGLVGGAYGLPVTVDPDVPRTADGGVRVDPNLGAAVEVTLPAQAFCPGVDPFALQRKLVPPTDSHNSVVGPPPYTLTVSFADPAVGASRRAAGAPVSGDVLSADNQRDHVAGAQEARPA